MSNKITPAKIILLRKDLNIFGILACQFEWVITDRLPEFVMAAVQFDPNNLSSPLNHQILFNTNYVNLPNFTNKNFAFLAAHEILHILHLHGIRIGGKDPLLWNVAADHVIERFLKNLSNLIVPFENKYNIIPQLHRELPNCTTEEAYDWLLQNGYSAKNKIAVLIDNSACDNCDGKNSGQIEVFDGNGNKILEITGDVKFISDQLKESSFSEIDQNKGQQIQTLIQTLKSLYDNLKTRGLIPGNIAEYLDKILEVKIPWERILENAIKVNCRISQEERSWRKLHPIYQNLNISLPYYGDFEDDLGKLIIAVDSSGSISSTNLQKFSSIIGNSIKYFSHIQLLIHDTKIHQNVIFEKENISSFMDFIQKKGFKGRGGTSHKEIFQQIEKDYQEDLLGISMVIFLTDCYSDIENLINKFKWVQTLPLIIIKPLKSSRMKLDKKIIQIDID